MLDTNESGNVCHLYTVGLVNNSNLERWNVTITIHKKYRTGPEIETYCERHEYITSQLQSTCTCLNQILQSVNSEDSYFPPFLKKHTPVDEKVITHFLPKCVQVYKSKIEILDKIKVFSNKIKNHPFVQFRTLEQNGSEAEETHLECLSPPFGKLNYCLREERIPSFGEMGTTPKPKRKRKRTSSSPPNKKKAGTTPLSKVVQPRPASSEYVTSITDKSLPSVVNKVKVKGTCCYCGNDDHVITGCPLFLTLNQGVCKDDDPSRESGLYLIASFPNEIHADYNDNKDLKKLKVPGRDLKALSSTVNDHNDELFSDTREEKLEQPIPTSKTDVRVPLGELDQKLESIDNENNDQSFQSITDDQTKIDEFFRTKRKGFYKGICLDEGHNYPEKKDD